MGYLVFFAAVKGLQDFACLENIPQTMPWRAFRQPTCDLVLLEWIQRPNRNNPPPNNMIRFPERPEFARRPVGISLPERFGPTAPGLDNLYDKLFADKRAGTLSKVAVQSALMLSEITGCPVLSIASDDDEWDLACEARGGTLVWLRFDAGHEELHISADGEIQSSPLPEQKFVHRIAENAAATWCEGLRPMFGFDGNVTRVPLSEVARVDFRPERPAVAIEPRASSPVSGRPQLGRPLWKFW